MEIKGLTQKEADKRLNIDGLNDVPDPKYNFWQAFASKLWNISAWILEAALILECFLGKWIQSFFVLLMLLFAAFNGATQKKKSRKVLNMIAHKLNPLVIVKRDNIWKQIDAKFLVVGDLISLKKGDILGADAKLVQGNLQVDQSAISGE
ncbi:MAG: cation-transporting P-type ATPase, partial [Lactobacillus iners]|nr:cation-transporting P-type ATPase [Lactobacillus iners]